MLARIIDGVIVEVLQPIAGFSIDQCFHPSVLAQCVDVGDAQVGDPWPPAIVEPEAPAETPAEAPAEEPAAPEEQLPSE